MQSRGAHSVAAPRLRDINTRANRENGEVGRSARFLPSHAAGGRRFSRSRLLGRRCIRPFSLGCRPSACAARHCRDSYVRQTWWERRGVSQAGRVPFTFPAVAPGNGTAASSSPRRFAGRGRRAAANIEALPPRDLKTGDRQKTMNAAAELGRREAGCLFSATRRENMGVSWTEGAEEIRGHMRPNGLFPVSRITRRSPIASRPSCPRDGAAPGAEGRVGVSARGALTSPSPVRGHHLAGPGARSSRGSAPRATPCRRGGRPAFS